MNDIKFKHDDDTFSIIIGDYEIINKSSNESVEYLDLENKIQECLDRVEYLKHSLILAEKELTDAKNKKRDFYVSTIQRVVNSLNSNINDELYNIYAVSKNNNYPIFDNAYNLI